MKKKTLNDGSLTRTLIVVLILSILLSLVSGVFGSEDLTASTEDTSAQGMCAHEHGPECFTTQLLCTEPEHIHTETCFDDAGNAVCGMAEHTHAYECYALSCGMAAHTHTAECYDETESLICGMTEHVHADSCRTQVLACQHVHDETCGYIAPVEDELLTDSETDPAEVETPEDTENPETDPAEVETPAAQLDAPVAAPMTGPVAAPAEGGGTATRNISWVPELTYNVVTDRSLVSTPITNSNLAWSSVKYQVDYSTGGETLDVGAVEIRLPGSIFTTRDGTDITIDTTYYNGTRYAIELSLTEAPTQTPGSSFNYTIDEDTGEIVITNFNPIDGAVVFHMSIIYYYRPSDIVDNYTKSFTATFKETRDNNSTTTRTDPLTVNVQTSSKLESFVKEKSAMYEVWQSQWGAKPANSEDYFYVCYVIRANLPSTNTQPFRWNIEEEPGNGGQVVSYYWSSQPYILTDTDGFNTANSPDTVFVPLTTQTPSGTIVTWRVNVVVQYPRSELDAGTSVFMNTARSTLVGIDDNVEHTKTSTAGHAYVGVDFDYEGDLYQVQKSMNTLPGLLRTLVDLQTPVVLNSKVNAIARAYDISEQGHSAYTVELTDDLLFAQTTELLPGDYEFLSFNLNTDGYREYDHIVGAEGFKEVISTDYASYGPLKVYIKTTSDNDWTLYTTVQRVSLNRYVQTPSYAPGNQNYQSGEIILPAGTYAIKIAYSSTSYMTKIGGNLEIQYNPTPHFLDICENYNTVEVTNVDTLRVFNAAGTWVNTTAPETISENLAPLVREDDREKYDAIAQHAADAATFARPEGNFRLTKEASVSREPEQSRDRIEYTLSYIARVYKGSNSATEWYEAGYPGNHDVGVLYDLLPLGTVVDPSTIQVQYADGYSSNHKIDYDVTIYNALTDTQFVENWRGSGQTMMIVHYTAIPGTHVIGGYDSADVIIKMTFRYTAYRYWDTFADYGSTSINCAALQILSSNPGFCESPNTSQNMFPDDGGGFDYPGAAPQYFTPYRTYFVDIDGDGNPAGTARNTIYAAAISTHSVTGLSQSGFTKSVKSESDVAYAETAAVEAGEDYSYRLRYAVSNTTRASDLVIYDFLETDYGENDHWRGTLQSVDVSRALQDGIDVKVYYSTVTERIPDPSTNPTDRDLTNVEVWHLWDDNNPPDLSTVTGIAVDLTHDQNGQPHIYEPSSSEVIFIHMKAPDTVSDYMAYNKAHCTTVVTNINDDTSSEKTTDPCNQVTLTMESTIHLDSALTVTKQLENLTGGSYVFTLQDADHQVITGFSYRFSPRESDPLMNSADGTFTLQNGQTAYIYGLANGAVYHVVENDYSGTGTQTKWRIGSGTNTPGRDATVTATPFMPQVIFTNFRDFLTDFSFTKVDGNNAPLPGATFSLYACTNTDEGHHHGTSCTWSGTAGHTAVSARTTGLVTFENIEVDTVWKMVETGVPEGYETPTGYLLVEVDAEGNATITAMGENTTLSGTAADGYTVTNKRPTATLQVRKLITNYEAHMELQHFLITLQGTGCNANGQVTLTHNETSATMEVSFSAASGTIDVSEAVPMEYRKDYTVTVINADGSTATVSGRTVTIHPGDNVTIVVNNTFEHTGYFKEDAYVRNYSHYVPRD